MSHVAWSLCLCVGHTVSCAKASEPIEPRQVMGGLLPNYFGHMFCNEHISVVINNVDAVEATCVCVTFLLQARSDTRQIRLQETRRLRVKDQPGEQNRQSRETGARCVEYRPNNRHGFHGAAFVGGAEFKL